MAGENELKRANYDDIRPFIREGDVVAFGGEGLASSVIKLATNSPVSHVGVVFRTTQNAAGMWQNQVIESTSLNGLAGVTFTRLSQRLQDYRGEVWWLPLSEEFRSGILWRVFFQWLRNQNGKPYNALAAIDSALDWGERLPLIGHWFYNPEKYQRLFCSQLVAGAFKMAGAFPDGINPSELTPRDLTAMSIYQDCVQLKGSDKAIKNFNRWPISHFID